MKTAADRGNVGCSPLRRAEGPTNARNKCIVSEAPRHTLRRSWETVLTGSSSASLATRRKTVFLLSPPSGAASLSLGIRVISFVNFIRKQDLLPSLGDKAGEDNC